MSVRPLRHVLALQSVLATLLPVALVVMFGFFWIGPQIRKEAGYRQIQLAQAVSNQVESHLEAGAAIVRAAAAMPTENMAAKHDPQQHLDALLAATDVMGSIYAVSPDGTVQYVALHKSDLQHRSNLANLDLSGTQLFRDVSRSNKPRWSPAFLSVINGGLSVAYGVPGNGMTLIGEVDLTLLTGFLRQISSEKDVLILIVDHNGQIVADNSGTYTAQQLNISNIPTVRTGIDTDTPVTGQFHFAGKAMTGSIVRIPAVDWHVMVAGTDASLYRTSRDIALFVLAGVTVALLSGLATSLYLARKLAARFTELTRHAGKIAEGEQTAPWPTATITEFNQLSVNLQQMARRLQDSEALYRTLFEELPDGVILWEVPSLRPFQFNPAAHKLLGYTREEFATLTVADIDAVMKPQDIAGTLAIVQSQGSARFESSHRTRSGEQRIMSVTLQQLQLAEQPMVLAIHRDITELKRAEEEQLRLERQLLNAQKLESLGVMAGGIAHDFNNILMAIIGNVDLALLKLPPKSPALDNLHSIEQAATRAAELAGQMLAYSGKGKFIIENVDLNRLMEEMLHMLEVSISKKVLLRFNLLKPLPPVEADATQMRQIIMNLLLNASEAIGDETGTITITTGCMTCDRNSLKDAGQDQSLTPGRYVYLQITDTGCGMDSETMSKLFDPFFTTKFTGRGLGMAAVLGIVRGHKGAITVDSKPGTGTNFTILLPANDCAIEQNDATAEG